MTYGLFALLQEVVERREAETVFRRLQRAAAGVAAYLAVVERVAPPPRRWSDYQPATAEDGPTIRYSASQVIARSLRMRAIFKLVIQPRDDRRRANVRGSCGRAQCRGIDCQRPAREPGEVMILAVWAVLITVGAARTLNLSPLFASLAVGGTIANASGRTHELADSLRRAVLARLSLLRAGEVDSPSAAGSSS
jgi:hypothetical protein